MIAQTVGEMYDRCVTYYGAHTALTYKETHYTYKEMGRMSRRVANALQGLGINKGDKIAFLMANCPEYVFCEYATAKIGAVPGLVGVAVDHITAAARRSRINLRWVQQDGEPVALVTLPQNLIEAGHEISLKRIEMRDGALFLAGKSQSVEESGNDQAESYSATARHVDSVPSRNRQL